MDVVLLITKDLRKQLQVKDENADDIFVEFFGSGVSELSIADRTAIANLCAEYGAKTGFFPVDEHTLDYLTQTGRDIANIDEVGRLPDPSANSLRQVVAFVTGFHQNGGKYRN